MSDEKVWDKEKKEDINILVVGDWIIDEDWVMMPERSETSAKLSDEKHFHTAFDDAMVATKSLCGASLTASAIRGFLKSREKQKPGVNYNVFGIGVWHPDDNNYIEKLFKAEALNGINPFRISTPNKSLKAPKKKNLFNLARKEDTCATTRMVRTFLGHPGTLPRAMCRYDWHLKWQPKENGQNDEKKIIAKRVKDSIINIANKQVKIDAIVLSDFDKGLINDDLVEALIENIHPLKSENGLLWFHRSKQLKKPSWIASLKRKFDDNDRFIQFIDPRISRKSADGKILLCGSGITWDGLEFIRNNKLDVPKSKLAVLFNDNNCIAYDGEKDDGDLWVINTNEKPAYFTRGRSSIFLASLLILELGKKKNGLLGTETDYSFGENCSIALDNGINWCNECLSIWSRQKIMQVSADINKAIKLTMLSSNIKTPKNLKWSVEDSNWSQAKSKENTCCISEPPGDLRLEVWRAHTVLNEYTIIDDNRKQTTLNLVNAIQAFLDQEEKDRRRPLISLVKASPGSGKTFLAKCMANHFGFELLECNVAQLTGLDGLIHFFDQVDTAQRDGRKAFIFLDEVDSLVNGISAFSFLLELMWCGQYYRNGLKNTLKPFPGIFAMSRDPNNDPDFKKDHPKYADLISRIYGINCELKDFTPEESIYLFAKLLDKYFGQIAYIEKRVFKTISNTKLRYGPRSLELLISLLKGIRRDRVTMENLPSKNRINELKEHFPDGLKTPGEMNNDDKKIVRIIYTNPL